MKIRDRLPYWGAAVAVSTLFGCKTLGGDSNAISMPLQMGGDIPAAEGMVTVKPEDNEENVKIEAKHLAEPSRVTAGAQYYVVWLQPNGEPPSNIGLLRTNEDKEGKFEAKTPYRDFKIFVTAEKTASAREPSKRLMTAAIRGAGPL